MQWATWTDSSNMPYGCWQPANQAVAYTCIIMHGIISYLGTSVQDICQRKHTCDAFLLKQPQSFSPGIQSYLVSRHVCAIHVSMELHLQCFPIEITSLFRSVDIWCCHTRSYLVPRHGCAIHMSMEIHLRCFPIDTISLFRSTDIWWHHVRSYLVPRHQCCLLPPTRHTSFCILSIYWLASTLVLVISNDLLSTGYVLPLLGI